MTARSPLVTVGIAFHDEERFLSAAIASILRQSFTDFELVLVDDGSKDDSLAIARSFSNDPRVRIVSDGERRRLPARLNEIVRLARGRFVARMDGDDISHPERLSRELALFHRDAKLDVVGTWAALADPEGHPFGVVPVSPDAPIARSAIERGLLVHATIVGCREWFLAHPYDESLYRTEDRDLWCRTHSDSRFAVVAEPLYVVRVSPRRSDFLPDYRESQRQYRSILRRYGPKVLGVAGTARAYAGAFAKSAVMSVAVRLGLADRLVRRRGRPPTPEEERLIREALDAR